MADPSRTTGRQTGRQSAHSAVAWIHSAGEDGRPVVAVGTLAALVVVLYAPVIRNLAEVWWTRDDYSHGFLVVPVALYLAWIHRSRLRRLPIAPGAPWALGLLAAAGTLRILGEAGGVVLLGALSLIAMIAGLVAYLAGPAFVKALAFPIGYLFLMVPLWEEALGVLYWPLQLLTAWTGAHLLRALGVSAMVDRQYVILPGITLEVAQACSGVTYVVAILAAALPLAYLLLTNRWLRAGLILSSIIIAVASNSMRIVLIGLWALSGRPVLHGPFELFQAMFVAWVGVAFVIGLSWPLRTLERLAARPTAVSAVPQPHHVLTTLDRSLAGARLWTIAVGVLILSGLGVGFIHRGSVSLADFDAVPRSIEGWVGNAADLRDSVFRLVGADQELLRVYHDWEGGAVQVYIAHVAAETPGKKLIGYRTAALHDGAYAVSVPLAVGEAGTVNRSHVGEAPSRYPVVFWYQVNGGVFANRYRAKLEIMRNAMTHGRTNGALILVASLSPSDPSVHEKLERFARAFAASVRAFTL